MIVALCSAVLAFTALRPSAIRVRRCRWYWVFPVADDPNLHEPCTGITNDSILELEAGDFEAGDFEPGSTVR